MTVSTADNVGNRTSLTFTLSLVPQVRAPVLGADLGDESQRRADLQACYDAYKDDPAKLARCYEAARKKRDFCLGKIPGPVQYDNGALPMSSDGELLARIVKRKDFFQSILFSDAFDDWNLARELGEFLVRIEPDSEIMGHALLARAYRHLGSRERAFDELKQCQLRVRKRELKPWELELFFPFLAEEEKLLTSGPETDKA